ncbi:MAG: putative membrane protein, partial [Saprospiraceae bacterium]
MSQFLSLRQVLVERQSISILLVWLFHLSAMIGISIGFENWFMSKTPINLSLIFMLLLWSFSSHLSKFSIGIGVFFIGGMFIEWLGVHYGFLFGTYEYGSNLGPKILEVPWFIGINWALLTLITGVMATSITKRKTTSIIVGASLMVFLDIFLEFSAPIFDFWRFENGIAPLKNYIAWFGIAILFHFIFQSLKLKG